MSLYVQLYIIVFLIFYVKYEYWYLGPIIMYLIDAAM